MPPPPQPRPPYSLQPHALVDLARAKSPHVLFGLLAASSPVYVYVLALFSNIFPFSRSLSLSGRHFNFQLLSQSILQAV